MGVYAITLDQSAFGPKSLAYTTMMRKPRTDSLKTGELAVNTMNAINILPLNEPVDSKLQKYLDQWKSRFDYHYVDIFFNIRSINRDFARGVKQLDFMYRLTDENNDTDKIKILDIIPKTKWVKKNYHVSLSGGSTAEGKVGFSYKSADIVDVDVNAKVNGSVSFDYKWNPKIAAIISNSNSFIVNNSKNKFLDGRILMTLLVQRDRKVKEMFVKGIGSMLFDIGMGRKDIRGNSPSIAEEIIFNPSKASKRKPKKHG